MSNFKKVGKRMGVDFKDFAQWMEAAMKARSPHRRLLNLYDKSLERVEVEELKLQVWIRINVDKPTFDADYRKRGERLAKVERASVAALERVFGAYRRDRESGQ
jgi:hypothetical protein